MIQKYRFLSFFYVHFCIAMIGIVIPLYSSARPEQSKEIDNRSVAVLLPSQREKAWVQLRESYATMALAKNVPIYFAYSDMDVVLQEEQINDVLLQNISMLIISPVDDVRIGRTLNKARYASLHVFSINSLPINTYNVEYYIDYDYVSVARSIATSIRNIQKHTRIEVLFISDDRAPAEQLLAGLIAEKMLVTPFVIQDYRIYKNINKDIQTILRPYIKSMSPLLLVSNLSSILDKIDTYLTEQVKQRVLFAGLGGSEATCKRFQQGRQIISILEDSDELSHVSLDTVLAFMQDKGIEQESFTFNGKKAVPTKYLDAIIVSDENYKSLLPNCE